MDFSDNDIKYLLKKLGKDVRLERENPDPSIHRMPGVYFHKIYKKIDIYQKSNTGYWFYGKGLECNIPMTKLDWLYSTYLEPTSDEYFDLIYSESGDGLCGRHFDTLA